MGDGSTQAHPAFAERFRSELAVMARRDGALYALAFCTLIAGFLMQPVTGRHPDWDLFSGVFRKLFTIGGAIGSMILAWQLARVALVERCGMEGTGRQQHVFTGQQPGSRQQADADVLTD